MDRYTVSDLTRMISGMMSANFPDIVIEGEISGFKPHGSGHWYFNLKDEGATIACAMWRQVNQKFEAPRDGEKVFLRGKIDVYAPRGSYTFQAWSIKPVGAGDQARKLEELRRKLAAEGLFNGDRKRPLPRWPEAIGIATSSTGAALQDILKVLSQRFPSIPVYIAPCKVQGEGAAEEVVAALELLNRHGKSSVIIVGRGGGSAEDLSAFNDERICRAVVASRIPIVSAVGHEVDFCLCDYTADQRAATPTHAAQLVSPDRAELRPLVAQAESRLQQAFQNRLRLLRDRLRRIRLLHPTQKIEQGRRRCDELSDRLHAAIRRHHRRRLDRFLSLEHRLRAPTTALRRRRLLDDRHRLLAAVRMLLEQKKEQWVGASRELHALSPLAVLDRGYTLAFKAGRPVQDAAQLTVGDRLDLRFARGQAQVEVLRLSEEGE